MPAMEIVLFLIEGAGFLCGVSAVVLLMFGLLGWVIAGANEQSPRLIGAAAAAGLVFSVLGVLRVGLG